MPLEITLLIIFLYQPFKYQTFAVGFYPLVGCRFLAFNPKLQPMPSTILAVIVFVLVFGQIFYNWLDVI